MTLASLRALVCVTSLALAGGIVHGCSLNPQPLPPGERPDSSTGGYTGGDASTTQFGGDDAGGKGGDGAGGGEPDGANAAGPDAGGTPGLPDGGDGGSLDGSTDAGGDAPEDAPIEASADAEEDGG